MIVHFFFFLSSLSGSKFACTDGVESLVFY